MLNEKIFQAQKIAEELVKAHKAKAQVDVKDEKVQRARDIAEAVIGAYKASARVDAGNEKLPQMQKFAEKPIINLLANQSKTSYNIPDIGKQDPLIQAIYEDWYKDTIVPLGKLPGNDSSEGVQAKQVMFVPGAQGRTTIIDQNSLLRLGESILGGAEQAGGAFVDGVMQAGGFIADGAQQVGGAIVDGAKQIGEYVVNNIAEGVMDFGAEVSKYVTAGTSLFSPYIYNNYNYNKNLHFPNMINGQDRTTDASGNPLSAREVRMGYRKGDYNGCAWIATYNAAKILGENYHPADIVKYYETHGSTLLNAEFGVNPIGIKNFFEDQGFNTEMYSIPFELDSRIKDSTTSIMTYWTGSTAHTVAVRYVNGWYLIFNEKVDDANVKQYRSIDTQLKNGQNGEFVISLITVK